MKKKKSIKGIIFALFAIFILAVVFIPLDESERGTASGSEYGPDSTDATAVEFWDSAVRSPQVKLKGNGEDTVTVLVYMNGSDLETEDGQATVDLQEMVAAGESEKVNILVETLGTKKWSSEYNISSKETQIHKVGKDGLTLVSSGMGQLDCTREETLRDFITWGAQNYPADRYVLILWNHGGGPVYGFGSDEFQSQNSALTIDEIQRALAGAGVYFDFIGMDCCIMGCLEVCCACYDYCDYMILSEDFESGLGWSYTPWLKELYKNTSISTPELGKNIVNSMVKANENDNGGDDSILAVLDMGCTKLVYTAWKDFAYANEDVLLGKNYSRAVQPRGKALKSMISGERGMFSDFFELLGTDDYSMADYYITDIMEVASSINSTESDALRAALDQMIVHVNACGADGGMTGIAVSLPYGDSEFYSEMVRIFLNCGFDQPYVAWLNKFTTADGYSDFYDYESWDEEWDGWDSYDAYEDWDWNEWDFYDDPTYWEENEYYWESDSYCDDCYGDEWCDENYCDYYYDPEYDDYYYDYNWSEYDGWEDWDSWDYGDWESLDWYWY